MDNNTALQQKRDNKARPHLQQYAPVWLTEETTAATDETILFSITFQHKDHGWVSRKYYYDGFNNTLYYRGQTTIPEENTADLNKQEPYITAQLPDPTNSYGG